MQAGGWGWVLAGIVCSWNTSAADSGVEKAWPRLVAISGANLKDARAVPGNR